MVVDVIVRNAHRIAYREGRKDELPEHVLMILDAEAAEQAAAAVKTEKEKNKKE